MQEEKQILDGIHIILENGWVVQTDELLTYFDLLGLRDKSRVNEENLKFLEFVYLVCRLFDADIIKVQEYFEVWVERSGALHLFRWKIKVIL